MKTTTNKSNQIWREIFFRRDVDGARAWHAELWDSRDTSSYHHADNSWRLFFVFCCVFFSQHGRCLLYIFLLHSLRCRRPLFSWDTCIPMVIYELRRSSALSIMTGQKDKLNGRALSHFDYNRFLSFFLSSIYYFPYFTELCFCSQCLLQPWWWQLIILAIVSFQFFIALPGQNEIKCKTSRRFISNQLVIVSLSLFLPFFLAGF